MHSGNGEVISFNGLFGSCFDCHLNQNTMKFHEKRMLKTLRNKVNITELTADDEWTVFLTHHAKDMPFYKSGTLNGKLAFPIPSNLSGSDFRNCPEMVIRDVIRMWFEVNDSLPGIGHAGTKRPSELHFQIVMFLHKLSSIVQCACALEYRTTCACLSTGYEFIPPSFFPSV